MKCVPCIPVIFYREGFQYDTGVSYETNAALVTDVEKSGYFKRYADVIR